MPWSSGNREKYAWNAKQTMKFLKMWMLQLFAIDRLISNYDISNEQDRINNLLLLYDLLIRES